jgi:serine/threonine protein kinase
MFYKMGADRALLQYVDAQNPVPHKQFSISAPVMYVEAIPQAGRSLAKLDEEGFRFTAEQAKDVINDLVAGLALLHRKKFMHGDIHKHNIVVDINPNGKALARFIDFGEMKLVQTGNFQDDAKSLIKVIHYIMRMTPPDQSPDYFDNISDALRGAPPMSAIGISAQIRSSTTVKRRRSSPSGPSGSPVAKALSFL